MKAVRPILLPFVALGLVLAIATGTALAQAPVGSSPASAPYIDNQPHTIAARAMQYYRFDYTGDNSPITIALLNGARGDVAFNVYTPEQIHETTWWLLPPIGRGTQPACGSRYPDGDAPTTCTNAYDLLWVGRFYTPGTYYVEVQNFADQPHSFTLTISGASVSLCSISGLPCPPFPQQ